MVPLQGRGYACGPHPYLSPEQRWSVFLQTRLSGYNAVASYDHINWFRVPTRFDGETLHINLQPQEKQAWIAYFEPYSRERHDWLIDQALNRAGTQLLATGKSVEGRDIQLLRRGKGDAAKRKSGSSPNSILANTWPNGSWKASSNACNKTATMN